ncbi:hypothetical protein [Enterococcus diestrammenae]|uniref:Uncharacterized protein n=1 Tax=Enterococcus diestrammenae TaxID=1155073 RepID=A0ABV0F404_9ENTE|nr:hypothetical protein [Enterococcus diestrammenae]KAF1300060.1 hypothetical protein BAU18_08355 [Enterococcus diestrammenae]HIX69523.1 hypothetical protein [Candidatus Enterococcus stercoravium]
MESEGNAVGFNTAAYRRFLVELSENYRKLDSKKEKEVAMRVLNTVYIEFDRLVADMLEEQEVDVEEK